jgi:hypothetical protein
MDLEGDAIVKEFDFRIFEDLFASNQREGSFFERRMSGLLGMNLDG